MGKGVSGKTHTKQQVNHYANQYNPNNNAHKSSADNRANQLNPSCADKFNTKNKY